MQFMYLTGNGLDNTLENDLLVEDLLLIVQHSLQCPEHANLEYAVGLDVVLQRDTRIDHDVCDSRRLKLTWDQVPRYIDTAI
jgi:hypothetical protein